jgi:tetratricopeptide (TPR) repeat protein
MLFVIPRHYTAAAECYLQYGDIKCAVRAYENAANASTNPSESIRILSIASVACLQRVNSTPHLIRLHARIAEIAESIGDFDTAIQRFREAALVAKIHAEIHEHESYYYSTKASEFTAAADRLAAP